MRQFFGACGEVRDVEFLAERSSGLTTAAHVTMVTAAGAAAAVGRLHGTLLHDRSVMVSLVLGDNERASGRKANDSAAARGVRITQQYRDRRGMFYELDCTAFLLTLTFVFPEQDGHDWCVQASTAASAKDKLEATGGTRGRAFDALAEVWDQTPRETSVHVPWSEVRDALKSVRAL
jgi:hypothetical protein